MACMQNKKPEHLACLPRAHLVADECRCALLSVEPCYSVVNLRGASGADYCE